MVDQWLGRKVLEKSFYDVQRFGEEGREVLRCAMHRTPKTFAGARGRARSSRGKEHSQALVKPTIERYSRL